MTFIGIIRWRFRKQLKESNFYEDVVFEDEKSERAITEWIFKLRKERNIVLNKFVNLLYWEEIIKPVRIRRNMINKSTLEVIITDANEKEFSMSINRKDAQCIEQYGIQARYETIDKTIYRSVEYKVLSKSKVVIQYSEVMIIDNRETIPFKVICILYDIVQRIATVTMEIGANNKIIIIYKRNEKNDDKIIDFLLSTKENNSKNVLKLFNELINVLGDKEDIVSIESYVKDDKCSEIKVKWDVVIRYSYTNYLKEENEYNMHIIAPLIGIEEFIQKYKHLI